MNKTGVRLLLLGLIAYIVSLAATVPAERAYVWARALAPAGMPVTLEGLEGTLWSGRAQVLRFKGAEIGKVTWSLSVANLLIGRASVDWQLRSTSGALGGTARLTPTGALTLSGIEGRLPAAEILRHVPYLPVSVEGMLSLRLEEARIVDGALGDLEGRLVWHQASVVAPQALRLGDLQITLERSEQGAAVGRLKDLGGPLEAEGEIRIGLDRSYRFSAALGARDKEQPGLAKTLALLGKQDAKGRVRVSFSGRL